MHIWMLLLISLSFPGVYFSLSFLLFLLWPLVSNANDVNRDFLRVLMFGVGVNSLPVLSWCYLNYHFPSGNAPGNLPERHLEELHVGEGREQEGLDFDPRLDPNGNYTPDNCRSGDVHVWASIMVSLDRFVSLEGADVLYRIYVHGTFCGIPTCGAPEIWRG